MTNKTIETFAYASELYAQQCSALIETIKAMLRLGKPDDWQRSLLETQLEAIESTLDTWKSVKPIEIGGKK